MRKTRILLIALLLILSMSFTNIGVSAAGKTSLAGSDPDPEKLTEFKLLTEDCCDILNTEIPDRSTGQPIIYTVHFTARDQYGNVMTGNNLVYDLYWETPGNWPDGITVVNSGNGYYDLEISPATWQKVYALTGVVEDTNTGTRLTDTFYLDCYRSIAGVKIDWDVPTLFTMAEAVLPLKGYKTKVMYNIVAVDRDGEPIPGATCSLATTDPNEITIDNLGGGSFAVNVTDAAKDTVYVLDVTASVSSRNHGSYMTRSTSILTVKPVLASMNVLGGTVTIPANSIKTEKIKVYVTGLNQQGNVMEGIQYRLTNLPHGVRIVNEKCGIYQLEIDYTANPGTYNLSACAIYKNRTLTKNLTLMLKEAPKIITEDDVISDPSVPTLFWKTPR